MPRLSGLGDSLNLDEVLIYSSKGLAAVGKLQHENGNVRDGTLGSSFISHDGKGSRLSNRL